MVTLYANQNLCQMLIWARAIRHTPDRKTVAVLVKILLEWEEGHEAVLAVATAHELSYFLCLYKGRHTRTQIYIISSLGNLALLSIESVTQSASSHFHLRDQQELWKKGKYGFTWQQTRILVHNRDCERWSNAGKLWVKSQTRNLDVSKAGPLIIVDKTRGSFAHFTALTRSSIVWVQSHDISVLVFLFNLKPLRARENNHHYFDYLH